MILKIRKILIMVISTGAILFFNCKNGIGAKNETGEGANSEILILNKLQWTEKPEMDEMARFIAAQPLPQNSRLAKLIATPAYTEYSKNINNAWEQYNKKHLTPITEWQTNETGKDCGPNIFYPFSGPDIVHASTLFPEARSFHLFALESPGDFPMPVSDKPAEEINDLNKILSVVGPVLQRPFWRTNDMKVQIGSSKYIGITSVTLFFLSRMNFKILDAYPVTVNANGDLVKMDISKGPSSNGVAIFYKKQTDDQVRALLFFQGDISDSGILKTPGLKKYIRGLSNYSTMLKSASYLLHLSAFDDTRNSILGKSKCILTDSSGVPFHYLNNGNWNLKIYGEYKGPVALFKLRMQPDLVEASRNNPIKMPFDYGYVFGHGKSHLILARRKAEYAFFEPVFDENDTVGESTIWDNPRFIRTKTYLKNEIVAPVVR